MPLLIQYIDAIARQKNRGVLFIEFIDEQNCIINNDDADFHYPSINWRELLLRQEIIKWLDENRIPWMPCGQFANTSFMLSYQGQIYVDVPYDIAQLEYRQLSTYFENSDGSMRFSNVRFCYLPLDVAMKNAEHDEPGFWEKWAELS